MPSHTITRGPPPEGAIHVGDRYEFAEGDAYFVGEVVEIGPVADSNKMKITLEMTSEEFKRLEG
jgi:hypothetical protein